uniref:Uncharacterized protein n=1 Tax=Cyanothece sp. (strain PCC 7425 / ATCC 29141) TaxID=395961 RepID=B8HTR9_CYAP4
MSFLSIDELGTLIEQSQPPCISIYLPTVRAGAEVQQNPIRFKNLIKQAEAQLEDYGLRHTEALELLQPVMDLDHEDFWQHQQEGLAIFIAQNFLRYYRLPLTVEELAVVSQSFHLKPLLPLLSGDGEFFILTLSQQQVQLFAATRYSIQPIEVEGLPESMDAALQYDETAKEGQFRISTSRGGTANAAMQAGEFHGQGSPDRDKVQRDILQYFYIIDKALQPVLHDRQAPLILAGVDYLHPIYKEANTYPHLLDTGITENTKLLSPTELHALVWPMVASQFEQAQQAALSQFEELTNTGKTSTTVQDSVPAAYYGRVDTLFVPVGVQQWGSYDPQSNELTLHAEPEPGDRDLLDAAAVQTLLNGGTVYALPPDQIPAAAPLAAVFRY